MSWYGDFIDSSNEKNAARSAIRRDRMGGGTKKEVLTSRETLLENALKAAEDLLGWYEQEHDRSNYEDDDVPEDLVELENEYNKAKERLK